MSLYSTEELAGDKVNGAYGAAQPTVVALDPAKLYLLPPTTVGYSLADKVGNPIQTVGCCFD